MWQEKGDVQQLNWVGINLITGELKQFIRVNDLINSHEKACSYLFVFCLF